MGYMRIEAEGLIIDTPEWKSRQKEKAGEGLCQIMNDNTSGQVNDEYEEAVKRFHKVFRPLQKKYNLRSRMHFSIYSDGIIEIYEHKGEERGKRICKVEESSDIECYNRAAEWLRLYKEQKERGITDGNNAD